MATQSPPAHPAIMKVQISTTSAQTNSPLPVPILTTSRLIVRPMHTPDAPSMSRNGDNPLISKYMSLTFPSPYTVPEAEHWINMNISNVQQSNFCICERSAPNVVIGGVGLKLGRDVCAHTAEVGFWIGENYWGKGYMTEVLEAFTRWSFESWEKDGKRLRKLCGHVYNGNTGSMRCFEKCGYSKEGVQRGQCERDGYVYDLHLFGLLKGDWERRTSEVFNNQ